MAEKISKSWGIDTQCVHSGEAIDTDTRAIRRPIHMANSYEMPTDIEELVKVFSWEHPDKFQYAREHSATPRYLEERPAVRNAWLRPGDGGHIRHTFFTTKSRGPSNF